MFRISPIKKRTLLGFAFFNSTRRYFFLAAFLAGFAFDLFEFDFAIIICLVNDVNIDRKVTMLYTLRFVHYFSEP